MMPALHEVFYFLMRRADVFLDALLFAFNFQAGNEMINF